VWAVFSTIRIGRVSREHRGAGMAGNPAPR